MTALLEAKGLTKHFGGIRAVDGVDLRVDAGERVGLIGPNGSGKTTVFNLLSGLYRPDRGRILFRGEDIGGNLPHRINARGIARTFQNIRLFRNMTVLDNVRVAAHRHVAYGPFAALLRQGGYRRGEAQMRDRARDLLSLFSLDDRRNVTAGNLPYGDQRRLEIVRALATEPKLLLLDEPAAGMNPPEIGRLNDFLLEVRERFRLAILLIEHQMRLVMGVCERLVVMDFGQVIARGTPEEVRRDPEVIRAYLGESPPGEEAGPS